LSWAGRSNRGIPDDEQLLYATPHGRAVLTCNIGDFERLDRVWRARGRIPGGIIISPQITRFAKLLRRVRVHLDTVSPHDQRGTLRELTP